MIRELIGVSLNIGSHAWYRRQTEAERAAASVEGWDIEFSDAGDDAQRQIEQIGRLLDRGADVLIVSATRAGAIGSALDRCQDAGVPVIGESIALHHPAVVAEVRVDDVAAGIALGNLVGAMITDRPVPRLAFIGHASLHESHDRERGFLEGFRAVHPDVSALYVDGRAQVPLARDATRRVVGEVANLDRFAPDVLFGVDDESVVGARAGYLDAGLDLTETIAATYGISPPSGLERLDDGEITYGVAMFPEWHGEILVRLALAAVRGEPHARLVHPPYAVVTAAGTPLAWDRFYRHDGDEFELDREAIAALEASPPS